MEEPTQKQHKLDQVVTERCLTSELQYVKFHHSKKKICLVACFINLVLVDTQVSFSLVWTNSGFSGSRR